MHDLLVICALAAAALSGSTWTSLYIRRGLRHEQPPYRGPLVLELEPLYPSGASGAILARLELDEDVLPFEHIVQVPRDAGMVRVRVAYRAGIYAGETTNVEVESEPPPEWLRRGAR